MCYIASIYILVQLFSNRFSVTKTHSQDFRHAYAYNSTATEHCTGCGCSLQSCTYAHYISAWRFALQELGKSRHRDFQVGWQSCWLRITRITINLFTYYYDSSGIRSTCADKQLEKIVKQFQNLCTCTSSSIYSSAHACKVQYIN